MCTCLCSVLISFDEHGNVIKPLMPPSSSPVVLCPESRGAWCYYDTALGTSSWLPPPLSTDFTTSLPLHSFEPINERLPRIDSSLSLSSCHPWLPMFDDTNDRVLLFHTVSGSVRE